MRLRPIDLLCPACGYGEERLIDLNEVGEEKSQLVVLCPSCELADMERIWTKAPMGRIGGEGSDRMISSMKQSFKDRFIKKDVTDVRHKFGKLYDEAVVSAAVGRIKKENESK